MTIDFLNPLDSFFVMADSNETPMHVGALMPFSPADGAPQDQLRRLHEQMQRAEVVAPWNRRLATHRLRASPVHWWVETDVDLEYHLRRSALPWPGDERELGVMVARLHSNPLDLSRPPWEMHLIEGLEGGRFAVYAKIHHALVDGISAMRLLARSLAATAEDEEVRPFFSVPMRGAAVRPRPSAKGPSSSPTTGTARAVGTAALGGLRVSQALGRLSLASVRRDAPVPALTAPSTVLSSRITRQRRFATQQYETSRLKAVASATGTTLNDVVIAICGGGLRAYLTELGQLPRESLVCFVPVDVREEEATTGGNAVGAILATLGTDIADPVQRLMAVHASTVPAKAQLKGMDQTSAMAYSAALLAPAALQMAAAVAGLPSPATTFNVCISNLPGPRDTLYLAGARMEATFPLSIPTHGMALNITLHSYDGSLQFGFIGCRDTLPHLQRLAVATGAALAQLEDALAGPVGRTEQTA